MRKAYHYPLFVAAALLLAMLTGCTLYMDEEEQVPEEQRGFEEPVHVQNDTVDVTYQFNEGTRVLTAHVQEYLVRVEADSILYFMDNTPQDYLPYAGGYVFSDCTDKLPWGLMHYVEQAGYVDGFYRVVCRDAAIKEVFKKFQLNIDRVVDYSKGRIVSMPDSMGSLLSDTVPEFETAPVNYTEYDDEGNEIGVPSLGRWSTRSDDDDDSDGNKDRSETSTFEFGFDSRNIVGGAGPEGFICQAMYGRVPNWLKGGMHFRGKKKNKFTVGGKDVGLESYKNLYWALKYTYTNTETTHVCIDSDRDFFEYYVDDETSHTFSVEAGYCAGVEGQWKPGRAVFEKIPKSKQTELLQTIDGPEIAIPLWGPVSLIINSSFDFDFHIAACGKFSYTRTTKKRKGMCYKDGSMERTDKLLESSSSNKVDFEVCGEAKAEISAHIGVGIRVGKGITLDGTFGGYVTAGVEVQASASLNDLIDNGGEKQPVSDRNFFHAYVKAGLELGLKVSFIGKSLYDQKYPVGKVLTLAEYKTCPYPEINYKGMKVTNLSGDDNSDFDFSDADFQLKMQYKKLGLLYSALGWKFSPYIDLIDTDTRKSVGTFLPTDANTSMWPLQKDVNYVYVYDFPGLQRDKLYEAVPHLLWDGSDYVYKDQAYYFTSASPSINFKGEEGLRQVKVLELSNSNTKVYYVIADLKITGASNIQRWGLKVVMKNGSGKQLLSEDINLKRATSKDYKILLNLFSTATSGTVSVQPYAVVVGKDGKTSTKNYKERKVTLSNNVFEFLGTEDEIYDDFDFNLNNHGK